MAVYPPELKDGVVRSHARTIIKRGSLPAAVPNYIFKTT